MKRLILLLFLLTLPAGAQQISTPPVRVTGPIGPGGPAFPTLHSGTITMTDADYNMLYPDQSASVLRFTSSVPLTATRNVIAPQAASIFFEFTVMNQTTGGQSIMFGATAGTGVLIPNGQAVMLVSNGTNYMSVGAAGGGGAGGITVTGNTGILASTTGSTVSLTGNIINGVSDCGMKGDGITDDSAALQACIDNHLGRIIFLPKRRSVVPNQLRPLIDYWMGTTTIHLHGAGTTLEGEGGNKWGNAGTALYWNYNTPGIQIDDAGSAPTNACQSCVIKDLYLSGPSFAPTPVPAGFTDYGTQCWVSTDSWDFGGFVGSHAILNALLPTPIHTFSRFTGIMIFGGESRLENVNSSCFNGDGIWIRGNTVSHSADLWSLINVSAFDNRGNGLLVEGGDSNAGNEMAGNFFGNELWGIWENSLLGNTYTSNHTNVNHHASWVGGINWKQVTAIQRVSNVVTACLSAGTTVNDTASGLAANNPLFVHLIPATPVDPSALNTVNAPAVITAVSATPTTACTIPGYGGAGGWIQWSSTGADITPVVNATSLGQLGITSTISSVGRTSSTVTITAAAPTTTLASDIKYLGTWVKILGTGTELDGHVFRTTAVTPSGTNTVNLTFRYLGPDIATVSTGYVWAASSFDVQDPIQTIRHIYDATTSTTSLHPLADIASDTAQFPANIYVSGPNATPQPVRLAGAGPGGTILITTAANYPASSNYFPYSNSMQMATASSQAVTNVEADFGGGIDGGAYQSTTHATNSVWINPYYEAIQGPTPLRFGKATTVFPGNFPIAALDLSVGTPAYFSNQVISGWGGMQFHALADVPSGYGFYGGTAKTPVEVQTMDIYDYTNKKRFGVWHDWGTVGYFGMADDQILFSANTLEIRQLNTATSTLPPTGRQSIRFGYGNSSDFQIMGRCATAPANSTLWTLAYDTGNVTWFHPCYGAYTTAANPITPSGQLIMYGSYWNPVGGTGNLGGAQGVGWQMHHTMTADTTTTGQLLKSTMQIEPLTQLVTPHPLYALQTPTLQLDSYTFANLTAWKTQGVVAGTQAFCNNCTVATPATCSITTPTACACAQGTTSSQIMATYENLEGAGANWYCAAPGSASSSGGGNVSSSGSPTANQTAVWATPSTITGVGPGTVGQVLTSTGPTTPPSFQNPTGGAGGGPIVSPLVVPSTNGTQNLTITVPNTGGGNPVLSSSTGAIDISALFVTNLAGTGPSCLQTDALGNVSRSNNLCGVANVAISDLVAANRINTLFNGVYQQNWLWHFPAGSTNQSGLNLAEQDLGAGTGNSVVTISSFAASPTTPLTVTAGSNGTVKFTAGGQLSMTGVGGIVSSTGITSDVGVSAPAFFTCTAAAPCITPASAPLGRTTGGEPLSTFHLGDFSATKPTNGQVPVFDTASGKYIPGTPASSGGGPPSGSAGGDLSGTYPNPQVKGLGGFALPTTGSGNLYRNSNGSYTLLANSFPNLIGGANNGTFTISGGGVLTYSTNGIINSTQLLGSNIPALASGYLHYNGSAFVWDTPTGTGGGGSPTFPVTTHTGNYSPTVSDFDTCPTHVFRNVASSAVVTLPNPAPASGKCMKFLNLGGSSTVSVIINSNNRTVNGATSVTNILIPAPTANNGFYAVGVMITSDGTNYVMETYSPIPVLSDLGNPNKNASWNMGNYSVTYNWNYATAQTGGLALNGSATATGSPTLFSIYSVNAATTLMDVGASWPNGFKVPASTGNIVLGGTSKLVGPVQLPATTSAACLGTDASGNIGPGTCTGGGGSGGPVRWSDLQNPAPYANLHLDMAGNGTEFDFGSGGDGVRGLTLSEYYPDINANVGTMLKIYTSSPSVSPMEVAVGDGSGFSMEGNTGSMQFWGNAKVEAPLRLTLAAPIGGGNPVANAGSLGTDADGNIIPKGGGAAGLLCNNFTAGTGQTTAPVSLLSCTPSTPLVVGGHYRIEAALRVVATASAGASTVTINQGGVGGTVVCPSGVGTTPAASTLDGLLQCEFTVTSSTSAAVFQPVYVMSAPGGGNNFWRTAISSNNQTITTTGTPTIDVVASTIGANSTWTGNSLVIYRLY